jgi:dipeptidyl aminopeptidase/acylaminoacyl peptidase
LLATGIAHAATVAAIASKLAPTASAFTVDDITRIADLTEPALSPDGTVLAYVVTTSDVEADATQSDLWRVDYDGTRRKRLTDTPEASESTPRWSRDGSRLAFLSDAPCPAMKRVAKAEDDEDAATVTQLWTMKAGGGRVKCATAFPGGVEDFTWAPDGARLAVVARDAERAPGAKKPKNPPPIVTDRYQMVEDGIGYLGARRTHVYVVALDGGDGVQVTSGAHDELMPAWSPDGQWIAYVTKRGADPDRHLDYDIYLAPPVANAPERQLTTFKGSDLDPYWESRPAWSPDSTRIAYLRSGEDKWIYYAPWQLAIVEVATGKESVPAPIDRCMSRPQWSPDGRSVFALVEQSRATHLARIDVANGAVAELTHGPRFDYDLSVSASGRLVVLGEGDLRPYRLAAVENDGLRVLADHNEFLAKRILAPAQDITFASPDGTSIDALLVKPVGYVEGQRVPTILRVHGGPVYQVSHEFMPDWQVYAANGYAVLAVNPRGSSGRGFDFARAIYADWGNVDAADVLAGVDHAVALGIADKDRLGIGGWSYGGILTDFVIAKDTRFKAAISGAGAGNMYAMYGHDQYIREYEIELGTPWANRDAYDRASAPFLHADRIATPTLFQCAGEDRNVPCLGAEQMYQALRSRGIATQLVVYPGENHSLTVPSYLRDRMARNLAWYDRWLKGARP